MYMQPSYNTSEINTISVLPRVLGMQGGILTKSLSSIIQNKDLQNSQVGVKCHAL